MKTQVTEEQVIKAALAKATVVNEWDASRELTPAGFIHNVRLICAATGREFVQVVESIKDYALRESRRKKELARLKRSDELEFEQAWETAMPSYVSFTGNHSAATN